MKKSIQILTFASVAIFSTAAFAGKDVSPGGNTKPTAGTTAAAAIQAVFSSTSGASAGVTVSVNPAGAMVFTPVSGVGRSFPPTSIEVGGKTVIASAENGTVTIQP